MSEESNISENKNISERRKKFDDFTKVFDSIIYRINEGLGDVYGDIMELAQRLEEIIPKFMIAGEIKKRIKLLKEKDRTIQITDKMIDNALSSEYKEPLKSNTGQGRKMNIEQSTRHLKTGENSNDDKKVIEVSSTGQSITKESESEPIKSKEIGPSYEEVVKDLHKKENEVYELRSQLQSQDQNQDQNNNRMQKEKEEKREQSIRLVMPKVFFSALASSMIKMLSDNRGVERFVIEYNPNNKELFIDVSSEGNEEVNVF